MLDIEKVGTGFGQLIAVRKVQLRTPGLKGGAPTAAKPASTACYENKTRGQAEVCKCFRAG
jgi:hypothetical protein